LKEDSAIMNGFQRSVLEGSGTIEKKKIERLIGLG
jgi:hypothetical protein